ncbi:MAG TPA: hypothetical protein PKX38_10470 [Alphaproteobacteria bacterium]|nr:hypothetical protein [Micavibrio sp.]MBK9563378.1 hypothetical protein [Micavibrio sp.]HQX28343.1 hypothetical protein [Alphaproteobacteria bacterium]
MQLKIIYQNTVNSDAQSYREGIDKRVDQIFGAAETTHSLKFERGEKNELRASLQADQIWELAKYLGEKFITLNKQLIKETPKFSQTRTAVKMIADFGNATAKEVLFNVEIATTENEYAEALQIPYQNS